MRRTTAGGRRGLVLLTAFLAATGVLAGCGGNFHTSPTPTGVAGWLASIPDTANYRRMIAVNDLHSLWTKAGLAFPPSASQLGHGAGLAASDQIGGGSQIGTVLWERAAFGPEVLGYDPLAISAEVSAGAPGGQLSLVSGTIDTTKVQAAMSRLGVQPASTRGVVRYTITDPLGLPADAATALVGVRNLAVLSRGGRAAAGGPEVPPGDVINLLRGSHPSPSLASNADVRQTLGLLNGADVMVFGTSMIVSAVQVLGPGASPAVEQRLGQRLGLDRLPAAPTFVGYGYLPGHPTDGTALAVAIYPNAGDAKAAANIIGNILRFGTSLRANVPYSQLFAVDTISIHGDALVARLTDHKSGVLAQEMVAADFPLFWSPLP